MVFVAPGVIVWTSIHRLIDPQPLDEPGLGLALSSTASLINLVVGTALLCEWELLDPIVADRRSRPYPVT